MFKKRQSEMDLKKAQQEAIRLQNLAEAIMKIEDANLRSEALDNFPKDVCFCCGKILDAADLADSWCMKCWWQGKIPINIPIDKPRVSINYRDLEKVLNQLIEGDIINTDK